MNREIIEETSVLEGTQEEKFVINTDTPVGCDQNLEDSIGFSDPSENDIEIYNKYLRRYPTGGKKILLGTKVLVYGDTTVGMAHLKRVSGQRRGEHIVKVGMCRRNPIDIPDRLRARNIALFRAFMQEL